MTRVGAGVVMLSPDGCAVLLLRYRKSGLWSRPGGAVEPLETMAAAAVRESEEEVGVGAEHLDATLRLVHVREGAALPLRPVPWVAAGFAATLTAAGVAAVANREPEKHDELRWWPIADVLDTAAAAVMDEFTVMTIREIVAQRS
jgi:8-oxo-dGTP pyrophosphatase MutT (NUDIX family)